LAAGDEDEKEALNTDANKMTLLIVEDDQAMRQMCMSLFEREGFAAEGASSVGGCL